MAAEPTLSTLTKVRLTAFAAEMAAAHPSQARTIFTLQDTLEQRLPLAVQNQIIEKLNKDPKGTLAAAKEMIDKDPKILEAINKDPLKLATIMGVKPEAAPAVKPPEVTVATPPAPAAAAPAGAQPPKPVKPEPAAVAAAPAPAVTAPPVVISDVEFEARQKLAAETVKIQKMAGFEEFAARAEKSQSLTKAMDAMMGKSAGNTQDAMKALKKIQEDPEFFVKANKGIDQIPTQMRESVFTQIAEKPELGRRALAGDGMAKMNLMFSSMLNGGNIAEMFSGGGGFKGIMDTIGKIPPVILEAVMGIFKGNDKFATAPGVMKMGSDGSMLASYGRSVDRSLGVDTKGKPVIDASGPDSTPKALGDYYKPVVAIGPQGGAQGPAVAQIEVKKVAADEPRAPNNNG